MSEDEQAELEEAVEIVALFLIMFPQHPLTESQAVILKEAMLILKEHNVGSITNEGQWQII